MEKHTFDNISLSFLEERPSRLILTMLTMVLSAIICQGIFNRYFHPLSRFPGPFWGSVTDFYKLYIVSTKQAHTMGLEMHAKYGPIVRVAPNLLAFNDPKLLPQVYHRQVDKTDFYSTGILGDIPPPFQTLKHAEHAAKRKRVAPSFSMSNLRKLEGNVNNRILEFNDTIRQKFAKTGEKIDFANWAQWFVYDLVTQLGFGEPVGFVEKGQDVGGLIAAFHEMAPMAGVLASLPWLLNPILKSPLTKRYLMPKSGDSSGTGRIMAYRDKMLADRLKAGATGTHHDFLDSLFQAKNADGSPMSIEEVKTECFVLMVAASDTTSAFICPFVNNIIQDSRIYTNLMAELESFEKDGRLSSPVVSFDETNAMPYFMACVKETLRYSPSTPMIMPRLVSKNGITLNGIFAPEGTEIGANPYVIHRNKEIFGEDADIFRPERWLEDADKGKEMEKYNFAWGYGTRICLGKNIAQMETQKLCLQLFRDFRIQAVNKEKPWRHENWAISIYWDQWLLIEDRRN